MKKKLLLIVPIAIVMLCAAALGMYYMSEGYGGLVSLFAAIDRTDVMRAEVYQQPDGRKLRLPYRIYVPEDYDAATKYPLVLFLHGSGECGDDNRAQTKRNSVMQTLLNEENLAKYPCIVLAPQLPETNEEAWVTYELYDDRGSYEYVLMALLEQTKTKFSIDDDRIYITGVSMGGSGTFGMLAGYPDYFAAAVPISGGWYLEDAALMKDVPIWMFDGAKDKMGGVENSRDMVKALEEAGAPEIKYTEYPKEKHKSWERAYREPELFPWLFAQTRQQQPL